MNIAGTQREQGGARGGVGGGWTHPSPFSLVSLSAHVTPRLDLLICREIDFEIKLLFFCRLVLKCLRKPQSKRIEIKQRINWLNPERRELLPISSVLCFPLAQPLLFFFFNCLIIHLRALIYPPSSALYVRPLCETFSWILNELVAYKVFLPGKAPIYGHVCLFFININPLGEERPYAVFSRTVPGTSLGVKSHCFSWSGSSATPRVKIQDN